MLTHYCKTIKFNNVRDMDNFCHEHITTSEDNLDYYRDGTYKFPMVLNATAMFCQNGDFTCFISGHNEFDEQRDTDLTIVNDFICVKNTMLNS